MKLVRRHFGVVAIILKKKRDMYIYKFMPELHIVLCCYGIFYFVLIHHNIFFIVVIVCLFINFFFFWVQDDAEAQGSSESQEKENSEEKMETSTEVCLQLINLKFPRTITMQQEGGILV